MSTPAAPAQAPGFAHTQIGALTVTTVYDGALPIYAADMHDESPERITELLADGFLPPEGDPQTAVNTFLFRSAGRTVLVDAGAGTSLGPGSGHLLGNLRAAGVTPEQVDDVLITHLHPDHVFGLVTADGSPAFPSATVHVSEPDAGYWLDDAVAASAEGVQAQIHSWAGTALAPYRAEGRLSTFAYGEQPVAGVTAVDLHGHTPGHSGFLAGDEVLFWGDTMHCHAVQLRAPHVTMDIDSDRPGARDARLRLLADIRSRPWAVGAAHLPFPGLGRILFRGGEARWVPAPYRPLGTV
ncbi:MBL fold metallo-hydrolase [Amycolatopsis thermophila]|uniref:Glyoxylase-like metal-dependent hydrolase (Beta-lactamase superfamily II) n=1 Tax=Amycolatopsis thermophila TaxID=206084 RepID=A0ABU0F168_9PSEU|nr:MBL fold metallo-hydrolase [Amycolatopsis thermophila]MDQ0381316.1 glyoxylase-like metal-dependent hydrolase (beta-lactamase superfamily II) [Amycolatopsis thermophila]